MREMTPGEKRAQQQRDEVDNEIFCWIIKWFSILFVAGCLIRPFFEE